VPVALVGPVGAAAEVARAESAFLPVYPVMMV
jgi:hypothetical protein